MCPSLTRNPYARPSTMFWLRPSWLSYHLRLTTPFKWVHKSMLNKIILHSKSRNFVTRLCVLCIGALCDTDLLGCFNWVHHSPLQDVDGWHPASTACVLSNQVVRNSSLSLVCRHTYGNSRYLPGRNRVRGLGKVCFLSIRSNLEMVS